MATVSIEFPVEATLIDKAGMVAHLDGFVASVYDQFKRKGSISERQRECLERAVAKFSKPVNLDRAKGGEIDLAPIHAIFDRAKARGLKKASYRAEGFKVTPAGETSANPGALYVKSDGGEYLGKVTGGKFIPVAAAPADTLDKLRDIAKDPLNAAIQFGKKTGICCLCSRELTNPESIARGIGPICEAGYF